MCWEIYQDYHVWTPLPGLNSNYCLIVTSDLCLLGLERFPLKKKSKRISVSSPRILSFGPLGCCWRTGPFWFPALTSTRKATLLCCRRLRLLLLQDLSNPVGIRKPISVSCNGIPSWHRSVTKELFIDLGVSSKDSVKGVPSGSLWGT